MLYDRWRQIVREFPNEFALYDAASKRRWTFAQLAADVESAGSLKNGMQIAYPQGNSVGFVLAVLRAWRANQVVCPLEPDQPLPSLEDVPSGIVHLKTTSATGGQARLVAFTGEQLAADAENIVTTMGLCRDQTNLAVISLAHSYGFSNLVTPLLLHGIPLSLAASPLPESVLQAAAMFSNIALPAVPAMWRAWKVADAIPTNVKLAISAGAPLPLLLEQAIFKQLGLKIHNFYGASECGGIAYDASEVPRTDAAFVGAAMKNVSLSVAEDGCLEVKSRAVAEGYLMKGGIIAGDVVLQPGYFRTSDMAELKENQVYLCGRASDLINVAGRKVSPETVERALLQHAGVEECLVLGVPSVDVARGDEILAVVVSGEHEEKLRQHMLAELPAWQSPRHWWFVEALHANDRGKMSRTEWRGRWLDKAARRQSG